MLRCTYFPLFSFRLYRSICLTGVRRKYLTNCTLRKSLRFLSNDNRFVTTSHGVIYQAEQHTRKQAQVTLKPSYITKSKRGQTNRTPNLSTRLTHYTRVYHSYKNIAMAVESIEESLFKRSRLTMIWANILFHGRHVQIYCKIYLTEISHSVLKWYRIFSRQPLQETLKMRLTSRTNFPNISALGMPYSNVFCTL